MTKTPELAAAFLQKAQALPSIPARTHSINAFNALFAVQELAEGESRVIERILTQGFEPGTHSEERIDDDAVEIKRLTKELKAIKRQEMVLIGERIARAREIFKKYKKRSFRDWMDFTFGSFKTGYNYLAFYDLYISFPEELRISLKAMPAKAIYVLASRKAPLEQKIEIVRSRSQDRSEDLIAYIRSVLGDEGPKEPTTPKILSMLEKTTLLLSPYNMDSFQRNRLRLLIDRLQTVLELAPTK